MARQAAFVQFPRRYGRQPYLDPLGAVYRPVAVMDARNGAEEAARDSRRPVRREAGRNDDSGTGERQNRRDTMTGA